MLSYRERVVTTKYRVLGSHMEQTQLRKCIKSVLYFTPHLPLEKHTLSRHKMAWLLKMPGLAYSGWLGMLQILWG